MVGIVGGASAASRLFKLINTPSANVVLPAAKTKEAQLSTALNARSVAVRAGVDRLEAALQQARYQSGSSEGAVAFEQQTYQGARFTQDVSYRTEAITKEEAVFETRETTTQLERFQDVPVFASRDVFESRDLFTDRPVYEFRDLFEDRAIFETRTIYEDQALFETRDVYEDRPVYGSQPVYETRPVYQTIVQGTRSIDRAIRLSDLGIDPRAAFSIQIGSAPAAQIKFNTSSVSVTEGGRTIDFAFATNHGNGSQTLGGAIVSALDSITGLSVRTNTSGNLQLQSDNGQSITIADLPNGVLDTSGSPIAPLGLAAGTSTAQQTGTEQAQTGTREVQTGTQQVKTGTQQVQIGTQRVAVGTEDVQTGTERVKTGTEQIQNGIERVKTGTERVKSGTVQVRTGTERRLAGVETIVTGTETVQTGTRLVTIGTRQVEETSGWVRNGTEQIALGFRTVRNSVSPDESRLATESRKAIVEAVAILDTAIGPEKVNGTSNPYFALRETLGLSRLDIPDTRARIQQLQLAVTAAAEALRKDNAGLGTAAGLASPGRAGTQAGSASAPYRPNNVASTLSRIA